MFAMCDALDLAADSDKMMDKVKDTASVSLLKLFIKILIVYINMNN